MKKIISLLVLLTFYVAAFSQTTKTVTTVSKTNPHIKVFEQALGTGDVNTAIIALNYYITEQGTNTTYTDSLAMMYLERGSFAQCYYWADLRSKTKPDDAGLMEMKGICLEKLQQPKEAIAIFEKLFATSKSPFHGYKLMELQYSIKRLAECLATANATEKLQFKTDFVMNYQFGDKAGRTYLQAGVYNIHGLALYDLDQKAEARVYFEKAIALDSNFVLANKNLEAMNTIEANANKVNNNNNTQPVPAAKKQN